MKPLLSFFLFCLLTLTSPSSPAAPLRLLLTAPEATLDPAVASDLSSLSIVENLFDAPLRYHYLARPLALEANTLQALPQVQDGGKTYLLRIKPGIVFTPDAAFGGKPRQLLASDYVYSWKRLYDPALKSPWAFLLQGKILGDEVLRNAAKNGRFDYALEVPGLQVVDALTLRVRLQQPDANFLYFLAMPASSAVAHEVVQKYAGQVGNHPVGSGPYVLAEWQRSHKLVLQANPAYAATPFDAAAANIAPADLPLARRLAGGRLPRTARIEVQIVEEAQAQVLGLLDGQFDLLEQVPPSLANLVLAGGTLKPELAKRGLVLSRFTPMQTYYMWMNMQDAVLGGYSQDKIALRRAIALAYDRNEDIRLQEKGLAQAAQSPVAPFMFGYDAAYRSSNQFNLSLANKLLDKFGYQQRDARGWRLQPNGQPLLLTMHSINTADGRTRDEVWRKTLHAIGIAVQFKADKKSEINKAARQGQVQMFETNWIADFPDGENFLQLLYGPNSGGANYAHFQLPQYDRLYEQARQLAPGSARDALYTQMAQLIDGYAPWVLRIHPVSLDVQQPWLKNYKRHPVAFTNWRYLERAADAGR